MAIEVKMPRLSQTTDEVRLVQWLVMEGDRVGKGDPLCQVETDKTTMDVEAFQAGTVLKLCIPQDTVVDAGEVIAFLGELGEQVPEVRVKEIKTEVSSIKGVQRPIPGMTVTGVHGETVKTEIPEGKATREGMKQREAAAKKLPPRQVQVIGGKTVRATPLVQNIAQKKGISLENIQGTGPRGLITKKDLEDYLALSGGEPTQAKGAFSAHQLAVARSLTRSKQEIPHFYLKCRCFADALLAWREKNRLGDGGKVSIDTLIIYVVARALGEFPLINSSFIENRRVLHKGIHVGFAVAAGEELYAPVIRDANSKDAKKIDAEVKKLSSKARSGKLEPRDVSGGTFTVTNLGMYPVDEFCAIINPPQAGILAVGRIGKTLDIDENGGMHIRSVCTITGSFDHRIVNGAQGAAFMQKIKDLMEGGL